MNSSRRLSANRKNARASTGPKTAAGKARACGNARRHNLARPIWVDPAAIADKEALLRRVVSTAKSPELFGLAVRIAETDAELLRVRRVRHQIIEQHFLSEDPRNTTETAASLCAEDASTPDRHGTKDVALRLADRASQLERLDRYERRALSRRNRLIQDFDCLRILEAIGPKEGGD
jgi:hypothetical protein